MPKLDPGYMHLLRLVARDNKDNGWTKVSSVVYPALTKPPTELLELRSVGDYWEAQLTDKGWTVIEYC